MRSSPHALELFAASNDMIADANKALSESIEQMVFETLLEAGHDSTTAQGKARLKRASVKGISESAKDYDVAVSDMRLLVAAVV